MMSSVVCYLKNEKGENELVQTKEQIDEIIKKKILAVTGGHDNELRNLRRSLVAMWTVSNPKLYSKEEVDAANELGEKMFELNQKVEDILQEGTNIKQILKL